MIIPISPSIPRQFFIPGSFKVHGKRFLKTALFRCETGKLNGFHTHHSTILGLERLDKHLYF